jgi:hypothetical protein
MLKSGAVVGVDASEERLGSGDFLRALPRMVGESGAALALLAAHAGDELGRVDVVAHGINDTAYFVIVNTVYSECWSVAVHHASFARS